MQGLIHRHKQRRKLGIARPTRPSLWKKILDRVTLAAGIIGPLMVIPQIYKIYSMHQAIGVSALSWTAFAILDVPFIFYGLAHKERAIVTTYTMFCIANTLVAIGAVLYR